MEVSSIVALINIDIGNSGTRINTAMAATYNYQPTLPDGSPNPQTLSQFSKAKVAEYVKGVVRDYEARQAVDNAYSTAIANVDSQVIIT